MNNISRLIESYQSDPIFRKKTIFICIGFVVLIILAIAFVRLNFSSTANNKTKVDNKPSEPTKTRVVDTQKKYTGAGDFQNSKVFSRASVKPVSYSNEFLIADNEISFISDKGYFTSTDKSIITDTVYSTSQFFASPEGIIINEPNSSSIYNKEKKIKGFPAGFIQVAPFVGDGLSAKFTEYYFIDLNTNPISISKSPKIDLLEKEVFTDILFPKNKAYQTIELHQFGKNIYLLGFESTTREGKVDIYAVEKGRLTLQKELSNVESFKYGKNQVIYSQRQVNNIDFSSPFSTYVMDFTSPKLDIYNVNITQKLYDEEIKGILLAGRCSIQDNKDTMYCLAKVNPEAYNLTNEPDALLKINWKNNSSSRLIRDVTFSASTVYAVDEKNIYIVSQENKNIYKLNLVDSQ
jgi:hypothetical protein